MKFNPVLSLKNLFCTLQLYIRLWSLSAIFQQLKIVWKYTQIKKSFTPFHCVEYFARFEDLFPNSVNEKYCNCTF